MKNKFRSRINKWIKTKISSVLLPYYTWTVFEKQQKINEIEFRYIAANNSGYIKNLSSIDNINYLLDKNILIYRDYIIGFLFANYVKKTVESLSKKYKEK